VVIPKDTEGEIDELKNVKVAVFTCSVGAAEGETKGTVLIHNAEELMNFSKSEELEMEAMIKGIKDSGVDCIVTGGAIDDMALHFIEKYKMMIIRISSKFELRRLCRAIKARPLVAAGPVSPEDQGYCSHIYVKELGQTRVTVFNQDKKDDTAVATILLRASTKHILEDVDRAIDDGVNIVKAMCKYMPAKFVAGAGASDLEMSRRLTEYASTTTSLDQYSIKAFAEALEVFPRTLAENAGHDALTVLSDLYSAHEQGNIHAGVNIEDREIDMKTEVLDLAITKKQALKLATDAVTTILRVDQIIQARQAGGPKVPQGGGDDGGF
jgi:T-complex protein 1 subunit theta